LEELKVEDRRLVWCGRRIFATFSIQHSFVPLFILHPELIFVINHGTPCSCGSLPKGQDTESIPPAVFLVMSILQGIMAPFLSDVVHHDEVHVRIRARLVSMTPLIIPMTRCHRQQAFSVRTDRRPSSEYPSLVFQSQLSIGIFPVQVAATFNPDQAQTTFLILGVSIVFPRPLPYIF